MPSITKQRSQRNCAHQPESSAHEHPLARDYLHRQDVHNHTRDIYISVMRGNPVFGWCLHRTPCGLDIRGISRRDGVVTSKYGQMAIFQRALIWACDAFEFAVVFSLPLGTASP